MMTPISYRYTPSPSFYSLHAPCCFSHFYALLCALETINTPYAIYFFLIHHCTNSLSSLHIFVHHCTFCASLHTKTSPASMWQVIVSFVVIDISVGPRCNGHLDVEQPI